jgi:hypothetical protein
MNLLQRFVNHQFTLFLNLSGFLGGGGEVIWEPHTNVTVRPIVKILKKLLNMSYLSHL